MFLAESSGLLLQEEKYNHLPTAQTNGRQWLQLAGSNIASALLSLATGTGISDLNMSSDDY